MRIKRTHPPPNRGGPVKPAFDSTLPFLREGYPFISSRCDEWETDLFTTRIALRPVTFIRGEEAARLFYDGERFTREAAMPAGIQHLLQDKESVQALDGDEHRWRKRAFLTLMDEESVRRQGEVFDEEWDDAWSRLPRRRTTVLHEFARAVLTAAACRWAGIPREEVDLQRLTRELGLMIDRVAHVGPTSWHARWRRRGTESWAASLVEKVRAGRLDPPAGSALAVLSSQTDTSGELLSSQTAAVEVINILRPTLAVARFVVFAAAALHQEPGWRRTFAQGAESDLVPFAQEVRRFYPFFPAVPGRARRRFGWRGHRFEQGDWVILDLYGTCHDARLWEDPDTFRPERFRGFRWEEQPNALIAQGAGHHSDDHRCPGEWSTVELLVRAVRRLASADLQVPAQDLSIPLNRFPALPRSGFVFRSA